MEAASRMGSESNKLLADLVGRWGKLQVRFIPFRGRKKTQKFVAPRDKTMMSALRENFLFLRSLESNNNLVLIQFLRLAFRSKKIWVKRPAGKVVFPSLWFRNKCVPVAVIKGLECNTPNGEKRVCENKICSLRPGKKRVQASNGKLHEIVS